MILNRARKIREKADKPTELGDDQHNPFDPLVGYMMQHEENMTEKSVVKRIQIQLKKAPKYPRFSETESEDSDI